MRQGKRIGQREENQPSDTTIGQWLPADQCRAVDNDRRTQSRSADWQRTTRSPKGKQCVGGGRRSTHARWRRGGRHCIRIHSPAPSASLQLFTVPRSPALTIRKSSTLNKYGSMTGLQTFRFRRLVWVAGVGCKAATFTSQATRHVLGIPHRTSHPTEWPGISKIAMVLGSSSTSWLTICRLRRDVGVEREEATNRP